MNRHPIVFVAMTAILFSGIAIDSSAHAQQVGTYSGQTSDGHSFTITVGQDPSNDQFELTSLDFQFTSSCGHTGDSWSQDFGQTFADGTEDIIDGKLAFTFVQPGGSQGWSHYIPFSFAFHGKQNVNGKVEVRLALLDQATPPTKAEFCISQKQSFALTFLTTDRKPFAGPNGAVTR